ncbi:ycf3-interacting protein 1, chloroplastic [Humulus lupulus]|uniref:ycf3-interacting protein 1, chloroplastic n=1 Tax=Humulus lupulus TaxID=3486 RepID=UPI002B414A4A|nr:ycf3-interacting protein 1, chloroplastic [Humulus lupulus]
MGTQSQMQVLQLLQPLPLSFSSSSSSSSQRRALIFNGGRLSSSPCRRSNLSLQHPKRRLSLVLATGEDTASTSTSTSVSADADPEDLEYVGQIKRVLELLRKNRDMLFSEVKLTIMIEDPRDVERRRLLGIEEQDGPTREDLAAVLEEVNEGKIPENRVALRLLAEEMIQWPNLEVEAEKKKPSKSLYAKATDTGIDPREAARRLNMEWDTAAEIEDGDAKEETEVPAALGYGALYLVTAFPVIIGVSVVLILFYNSLQ